MKISAIIITYNEEQNIERCLRSLSWVDEIIINDSYSIDRTVELAKKFPNVQVIQNPWEGFCQNKNQAISKARNPWILWLDADEVVSSKLKQSLQALDPRDFETHDAFSIPRKTFLLNHWIRHCGWYPGRVIRLFHSQKARLDGKILHEGIVLEDSTRLGYLTEDILHYSYPSLKFYFHKMNKYGEDGARELARSGRRFNLANLALNPLVQFFKVYFLKGGFLDGVPGLIISAGSAYSNFIKYANFWALTSARSSGHPPVETP